MKKHTLIVAAFVAVSLLVGSTAFAQGSVHGNRNGFQAIRKGTLELSLDNLLLFNNTKVESADPSNDDFTSTFALTYTGGLTFRYFAIPNLAFGASADLLNTSQSQTDSIGGEETVTESKAFGFMFFGTTDYFLRLSNSFFLKPGIAAGFFTATRETPAAGLNATSGTVNETTLSGFAGKFNLALVFFVNQSVNLKAGIDIIFRSGNDQAAAEDGADEPDPIPFTIIEGGFNVGIGYVF